MRLDRVAAELRPRTGWEALDLGFALARQFAGPLWGAQLVVIVPIMVAAWTLMAPWPWLVLTLLWWVRPLLERVPLFVLSRALFGDAPTPRETLRATPGLMRDHKLAALTWLRADPLRAALLPVWQLEGGEGPPLARRRRLLARGITGHALALLVVCTLMEWALTFALLGLVFLFLPEEPSFGSDVLLGDWMQGEGPLWFRVVPPLCWTLATNAVEPLYVAGGFGLYINRRTDLEGWDIEIAFRRLAERLGSGARLMGWLLALSFACWMAAPALAADPPADTGAADTGPADTGFEDEDPPLSAEDQRVQDAVERVLADPIFPHRETVERWKPRWEEPEKAEPPTCGCSGAPIGGAGVSSGVLQASLWVGIALLLALLVRLALSAWPEREAAPDPRGAPPTTRLGLDIRPESLPPDVAAQALALWRAGKGTEALALLYRAALADLVHHRAMPVEDSDTERDCLQRATPLLQASGLAYFARLTSTWQSAAYGHRLPRDLDAIALCEGWSTWFQVHR